MQNFIESPIYAVELFMKNHLECSDILTVH